jgi:hypothetical protein
MRILSFCLLASLALTGCRSIMDPTFMPAGYSYHREVYKSPPGPPADNIGYHYDAAKNEKVQEVWRLALRDLLLRAKTEGLTVPENVMLSSDLKPSAFQGLYDSILREGLRAYGYSLGTADTQNQPTLFYSAYGAETLAQLQRGGMPEYNDQTPPPQDKNFTAKQQKMTLVIGLVQDGKFLHKTAGLYTVPTYGFDEGIYAYLPGSQRPIRNTAYGELSP